MSVGQPTPVLNITAPAPKLSIAAELFDSGNFTAMCWAYHTGSIDDSYSDLIAISDNNDVIGMATWSNGSVRKFSMGDLNSDIIGPTTLNDNEWYHLTMTVTKVAGTGTRCIGYINGMEDMRGSLINPVTPLAARVWNSRASDDDAGGVWIGNMCGVKIWDGVALTPPEIRREMWTYMAGRKSGLWACSPLMALDMRTHNYGGRTNLDWTTASTFFAEGTSNPAGVAWDWLDTHPMAVIQASINTRGCSLLLSGVG
jgi:hypothetical protein